MRKLLYTFVFLFLVTASRAQMAAAVDSMKAAIAESKTVAEKIYWMDALSRTLMNINPAESEEYGKKIIELGEESRDRRLMIQAYRSNGTRCSYMSGVKDYGRRSIDYYNKALQIARQDKLDDQVGDVLLSLSRVYRFMSENDKSLNYANQGFSIISGLHIDTMLADAYVVYGDIYLARNEKTLSLRNYLNALQIAEDTKYSSVSKKSSQLRNCYTSLSKFYMEIEDFDKAIDYSMYAMRLLDDIADRSTPYQRVMDINGLGKLYALKKNYDIAISYYERCLVMADSLKFSSLKIPAYMSILNQFLEMKQPQRALDYFNSPSGLSLKEYLLKFGFNGNIDQAYGYIYTQLGKLDSARYFFDRAEPSFENNPNELPKMYYYAQRADFHVKSGEYDKAIILYLKVKEIADKRGLLENAQSASKHLDSLFRTTGDFKQASVFNTLYFQYKDSIQELNKEKELAQVEVQDDQLRKARLDREQLEAKRKRFNIQYLAITIGIAGLFVIMVMMGMFKVSTTTIKMIGFFAFLMFFEFIFLIFKKNIYSITEGEPWKDLLFMILLAAILLPLHHWLEHKVIHYLTSHNRLTASGKGILDRMFRRKKAAQPPGSSEL